MTRIIDHHEYRQLMAPFFPNPKVPDFLFRAFQGVYLVEVSREEEAEALSAKLTEALRRLVSPEDAARLKLSPEDLFLPILYPDTLEVLANCLAVYEELAQGRVPGLSPMAYAAAEHAALRGRSLLVLPVAVRLHGGEEAAGPDGDGTIAAYHLMAPATVSPSDGRVYFRAGGGWVAYDHPTMVAPYYFNEGSAQILAVTLTEPDAPLRVNTETPEDEPPRYFVSGRVGDREVMGGGLTLALAFSRFAINAVALRQSSAASVPQPGQDPQGQDQAQPQAEQSALATAEAETKTGA